MTEVMHLMGQFIMERKHGVNLTVSDPAVHDIYKSHVQQTIMFHCELYLTTSLKCVLQGLINVRLW